MDPTEIRLRKIESLASAARTSVELQAQRRLAILGASLAVAGAGRVGAAAGDLAWAAAVLLAGTAAAAIAIQPRGLVVPLGILERSMDAAAGAIDKVMVDGGERPADAGASWLDGRGRADQEAGGGCPRSHGSAVVLAQSTADAGTVRAVSAQ